MLKLILWSFRRYRHSNLFSKGGLVLFLSLIGFLLFCTVKYLQGDICIGYLSDDEIFNESFPLTQNDSRLLEYIRRFHLIPPSEEPYNLVDPKGDPSEKEGQNKYVLQILNNLKGGYFVECGAWDGEKLSTTLVLERDYQWKGLLVEPNSKSFSALMSKNRKAWKANVCLSPVSHPIIVDFQEFEAVESNYNNTWTYPARSEIRRANGSSVIRNAVLCFPVFSILSALQVTIVDFFTLDIEGFEMEILRTIPFDSILIKIFCIEWNHIPEGKDALREFVESKGYTMVKDILRGNSADFIFAHNSVPIPPALL